MKNKDLPEPNDRPALPRRDLLAWIASAGAAIGLGSPPPAAAQTNGELFASADRVPSRRPLKNEVFFT